MYCICCDSSINPSTIWSNLLLPSKLIRLCKSCDHGLERIPENHCPTCSKPNTRSMCEDCLKWRKSGQDPLEKNISVFSYNEQIKEMIAKWKYRGDYELGFSFETDFYKKISNIFKKELKSYVIVPIPLSDERELERCFNQALMLSNFLQVEVKQPLKRIHTEKQSKKTRVERLSGKNPFILEEPIKKSVILVDDIYTTGTTLRHAASLLKLKGTPEVCSYTLVRG